MSALMLNVIMLSVIMLIIIMINTAMLCVVMLSVIMLNVVAHLGPVTPCCSPHSDSRQQYLVGSQKH
jgi:hypothetical protein